MVKFPYTMKGFNRLLAGTAFTASAFLLTAPSVFAQSAEANYEALLQQISDLEVSIEYRNAQISHQNDQIASLRQSIESADTVKAEMKSSFTNMVNAIEAEFEADPPFLEAERANRLATLRETLDKEGSSPSVLWGRALNAYKIEAQYGQNVEAYGGDHPIQSERTERTFRVKDNDKGQPINAAGNVVDTDGYELDEKGNRKYDGKFLRYGRMALMFMDATETNFYRYDSAAEKWIELEGKYKNEVREAMKVADGRTAPVLLRAPLLYSGSNAAN